ncbi:hypothetical protein SDC9_107163 [bioreactor metagenome]|uniref:Uncharacterized protein n=1 Tax=bioreactor metagenome TaxID=1076179 RepID=A0A645B4F1_9ZZZZ
MQGHCADGSRKYRQIKGLTEDLEGGVHGLILADGVHVDAQFLPLLIVADEAGADPLGSGSRNGVFTDQTIADRAGLAVGADTGAGVFQYFLICHDATPPICAIIRACTFPILTPLRQKGKELCNISKCICV